MKNLHLLTISSFDSDANTSYDDVYPVITDDMPGFLNSLKQRAYKQLEQLKDHQKVRDDNCNYWVTKYKTLKVFEVIPEVASISMNDLFKHKQFAEWRIKTESIEALYSRATPLIVFNMEGANPS